MIVACGARSSAQTPESTGRLIKLDSGEDHHFSPVVNDPAVGLTLFAALPSWAVRPVKPEGPDAEGKVVSALST
jgi:hypothetical protein